jgi:Uma2 family endonuclease
MVTAELVTAEQYLHTSFEHDAEFVEGRIVERPAPCWEHSSMQGFLIERLWLLARNADLYAVPEQRVRTGPERCRVPDLCLAAKPAPEDCGIVTTPPYLCVEILSPEDTAVETLEKVREYLGFGVSWVWVIDPVSLAGQVHGPAGITAVDNRIFFTDRFEIDLTGVSGLS